MSLLSFCCSPPHSCALMSVTKITSAEHFLGSFLVTWQPLSFSGNFSRCNTSERCLMLLQWFQKRTWAEVEWLTPSAKNQLLWTDQVDKSASAQHPRGILTKICCRTLIKKLSIFDKRGRICLLVSVCSSWAYDKELVHFWSLTLLLRIWRMMKKSTLGWKLNVWNPKYDVHNEIQKSNWLF